ncbi:MAG: hypothetical protein GX129_08830 [Clostridiales bacterium]|jgi:hypothetical protein|nr:hypothetical protein [Clostridiales bacterium]
MEHTKPSLIRTIFGMMINPAGALRGALSGKWYLAVAVSALAFGLFFAQTGLDLYKTGQKDWTFILLSVVTGIAYGLVVIPLIAVIIWIILKAAKTDKSLLQAISAFCLSYSGALIYGILGLIFSLAMGWKTSIAFGATGVLWAIGPMMFTIRELTGGKNALSVPLATLVSATVLFSWSLFGNL